MTKVEQGILINTQHQNNIINNIPEEISFKDQILNLGYKDLEEFFEDKAIFEMQQILKEKLFSTPMEKLVPTLGNLIQTNQIGILSIYTDKICVCHGDNTAKPLNIEYCKENNIPIYPYNSFGGNIVATKEDYGLVVILPSNIDVSQQLLLNRFIKILQKFFNNNFIIQDNDILMDNKKIVGSGNFGNDRISIMLFYFSMSDKGELIQNICGEPLTNKMPGHIDATILPTEQLVKELLSWLQGL